MTARLHGARRPAVGAHVVIQRTVAGVIAAAMIVTTPFVPDAAAQWFPSPGAGDRQQKALGGGIGNLAPSLPGTREEATTRQRAGPATRARDQKADSAARAALFGALPSPSMTVEERNAYRHLTGVLEDFRRRFASELEPAALAAELGPDPRRLAAWVRDNTGLLPYRGVLKGARGTLRARAGNSLDQALLLARLLEEHAINVRLARRRLPAEAVDRLVATLGHGPEVPAPTGEGFVRLTSSRRNITVARSCHATSPAAYSAQSAKASERA